MTRIALLDDYQHVAAEMAPWSEVLPGAEIVTFSTPMADEDTLVGQLAGFDVVVAMRERTGFTRSVLERLPDLRLLVTTGRTNSVIDLDAATNSRITVAGTFGEPSPTVEMTWALILALARHVPIEDQSLRAGRWQTTVGRDLAGRTLGLLGLGRIGARVAAVGVTFGMRVVAWSPHLTPERTEPHGVECVTKDDLFRRADVMSIHLVLAESTRALVGDRELELLGPSGLLVNTARGPIVDEVALIDALSRGVIGGAGIDVYEHEPIPVDHPLRSCPHTVLTPHLGFVTEGQYRRFYGEALEDIAAFLAGAPIRLLNPEVSPPSGRNTPR